MVGQGQEIFFCPFDAKDRPERAYEDLPGKERCEDGHAVAPIEAQGRKEGLDPAAEAAEPGSAEVLTAVRKVPKHPHHHGYGKNHRPGLGHEILRTAQRRLQERPPGGHAIGRHLQNKRQIVVLRGGQA